MLRFVNAKQNAKTIRTIATNPFGLGGGLARAKANFTCNFIYSFHTLLLSLSMVQYNNGCIPNQGKFMRERNSTFFVSYQRSIQMENRLNNNQNNTCASTFFFSYILFALPLIQLENKRMNKIVVHFLQFTLNVQVFILMLQFSEKNQHKRIR